MVFLLFVLLQKKHKSKGNTELRFSTPLLLSFHSYSSKLLIYAVPFAFFVTSSYVVTRNYSATPNPEIRCKRFLLGCHRCLLLGSPLSRFGLRFCHIFWVFIVVGTCFFLSSLILSARAICVFASVFQFLLKGKSIALFRYSTKCNTLAKINASESQKNAPKPRAYLHRSVRLSSKLLKTPAPLTLAPLAGLRTFHKTSVSLRYLFHFS